MVVVRYLRGLLVLALALAIGPSAYAMTARAELTAWSRFTQSQDGLPANDVRTLLPRDGGVWFGGAGGLSYYDGVWTAYSDLGTVTARETLSALAYQDGVDEIWGGTISGAIVRWDGERWSQVAEVRAMIHALGVIDGEVLVGSSEGLYRLGGTEPILVDAVGRQAVYAIHNDGETVWVGAQRGLWRMREERWARLGSGEAEMADGVLAIQRLGQGGLAVGVHTGMGIQLQEGGPWTWVPVLDDEGEVTPVQSLTIDHDSGVWAGTNGAGAVRLDYLRGDYQTFGYLGDTQLTTPFVRAVAVDRDATVWFATPAGVFRYQPDQWTTKLPRAAEDVYHPINSLLAAHDGAIWVGTGGAGVHRLVGIHHEAEDIFAFADGALDAVFALAEDAHGEIWIGGVGGVRRFADGAWSEPAWSGQLPAATVSSLLVDDRHLWIGTPSGLAWMDLDTGALTIEQALAGTGVEALAFDGRGNLWAGTFDAGIWRRSTQGEWRQFQQNAGTGAGLLGTRVSANGLSVDAGNPDGMWAAMSGVGLAHWDGARWEMQQTTDGAAANLIWALYTDPADGALWMGSEAGVTRYDGITATTLDVRDGLHSPVIYAILRTQDGGYWFGGRTGLSHFQPESTPPWVRITELSGGMVAAGQDLLRVQAGERLVANYVAGDVQNGTDVTVLARVVGPGLIGEWAPLQDPYWSGTFTAPGVYQLELMAQDRSFNYSPVAAMSVAVATPPALVRLPILGEVDGTVYRTLVLLGAVVVVGMAYLATTALRQHRRSTGAMTRAFNPYISGEPVRRDEMFFGRRDLLQRIVDTLHNNSIMIYGERRIGKTTLLYQLTVTLREVDDPDYWFVPILVDLEGTPQENFFHYLAEEIVFGLHNLPGAEDSIVPYLANLRYYTRKEIAYSDRDLYRDLSVLTEVLNAYGALHHSGKQLRLILLIDEMDVMHTYDQLVQQQLRRIFMREFAETLGAVVAGVQISREWERVESPWFNMFNEIALKPFTREQSIELLVEPVRGYYQYEVAALEFILDHAHGRPYRLQQFGLEAVNQMLAHRRRRITLADAEAAHLRIVTTERDAEANTRTPRMLRMLRQMLLSKEQGPDGKNAQRSHATNSDSITDADERPLS